ncbi:putative diphthamide synthesis protein-domain-containing protein [Melampsora americana]|nr:putative diphthamide synthesis protein-domain-containing protein [Melampsora americana]
MSFIGPSGESAIHDNSIEISEEPFKNYSDKELIEIYQINETVKWIETNDYHIIGLQFPDHLLPISVRIFKLLRSSLPASSVGQLGQLGNNEKTDHSVEIYLMADTTYGSCCVDCLAAQHVAAQAIVHYGPACLTTIANLAVYYVLPRLPLDDSSILQVATELYSGFKASLDNDPDPEDAKLQLVLMYDVGYYWKVEQVYESLKTLSPIPITLHLITTKYCSAQLTQRSPASGPQGCSKQNASTCCQTSTDSMTRCEDTRPEPSDAPLRPNLNDLSVQVESPAIDTSSYSAILYLGPCSRRLTHIMLTHSSIPIFALDPASSPLTCESQVPLAKKLLMKRYATIQRARDADVFGILIGTLGLQHDLQLIHRTKSLLERQFKKKSYIVSVGKLKPEKLINFIEIECWVLIACPEHSLLDEGISLTRSKQFNVPVITPWELDLALSSCISDEEEGSSIRPRQWDGHYVLDFDSLISIWDKDRSGAPVKSKQLEDQGSMDNSDDDDAPVYSMITGTYKHRKKWNADSNQNCQESGTLTIRDNKQELIRLVNGAASEYALNKRTYNGLEPRIGLDGPSQMEKGRFGIAQGYGDDHVPETS